MKASAVLDEWRVCDDWRRKRTSAKHSSWVPKRKRSKDWIRLMYIVLASRVKRECMYLSSVDDITENESYKSIVRLGKSVVPLLLSDLKKNKRYWFWALYDIAGENPVKPEHIGDVDRMVDDWLDWGVRRGYT